VKELIVLLSLGCLVWVGPVSARTWYINPEGTGDAPTIQAGIDSAAAGDEVALADGVYTGTGNRDIDCHGKALKVMSENGEPGLCIIDCDGSESQPHRGFYFHSYEDSECVVQSLTIQGGYAKGEGLLSGGGGVLAIRSSPCISNCIFRWNTAEGHGGGIVGHESDIMVESCLFMENSGYGGGGISLVFEGSPQIRRCVFWANSGAFQGGAVACGWCSPVLTGCTMYANLVDAIYLRPAGSPTIERTVIVGSPGRAVYCMEGSGVPVIACSDIYGNSGGDWIDCIAGMGTINGNLAADPRFCDPEDGNFWLDESSPCNLDNSPPGCGQIGAMPVGCSFAGIDSEVTSLGTWGRIKADFRREAQ
jgi:hypothetical protein